MVLSIGQENYFFMPWNVWLFFSSIFFSFFPPSPISSSTSSFSTVLSSPFLQRMPTEYQIRAYSVRRTLYWQLYQKNPHIMSMIGQVHFGQPAKDNQWAVHVCRIMVLVVLLWCQQLQHGHWAIKYCCKESI